jgi:Protein of unknown function (DUF3606)
MPDDTSKTGGPDRQRISTSQDYEVRDWAAKFDVTKDQLIEAVKRVGDLATDVEAHLKGHRKVGGISAIPRAPPCSIVRVVGPARAGILAWMAIRDAQRTSRAWVRFELPVTDHGRRSGRRLPELLMASRLLS